MHSRGLVSVYNYIYLIFSIYPEDFSSFILTQEGISECVKYPLNGDLKASLVPCDKEQTAGTDRHMLHVTS